MGVFPSTTIQTEQEIREERNQNGKRNKVLHSLTVEPRENCGNSQGIGFWIKWQHVLESGNMPVGECLYLAIRVTFKCVTLTQSFRKTYHIRYGFHWKVILSLVGPRCLPSSQAPQWKKQALWGTTGTCDGLAEFRGQENCQRTSH